jgi:hypothetical protein
MVSFHIPVRAAAGVASPVRLGGKDGHQRFNMGKAVGEVRQPDETIGVVFSVLLTVHMTASGVKRTPAENN